MRPEVGIRKGRSNPREPPGAGSQPQSRLPGRHTILHETYTDLFLKIADPKQRLTVGISLRSMLKAAQSGSIMRGLI